MSRMAENSKTLCVEIHVMKVKKINSNMTVVWFKWEPKYLVHQKERVLSVGKSALLLNDTLTHICSIWASFAWWTRRTFKTLRKKERYRCRIFPETPFDCNYFGRLHVHVFKTVLSLSCELSRKLGDVASMNKLLRVCP